MLPYDYLCPMLPTATLMRELAGDRTGILGLAAMAREILVRSRRKRRRKPKCAPPGRHPAKLTIIRIRSNQLVNRAAAGTLPMSENREKGD